MPSISARINATLFHTSAACGHALWREQLALHEHAAAQKRHEADNCVAVYTTAVWHTGWQVTCAVRDMLSRPTWDRAIGTGWDRGETRRGPGQATETGSRPARSSQGRYDLGRGHRAVASLLGGGEGAVLATHLPFFLMRMGRHAAMGSVTGVALSAGLIYGACIIGPYDTYRYSRGITLSQ
jgi:hypothetical protein